MKDKLETKYAFAGAGIGLGLFAIFGLMPGAFVGGVLGLNMVNSFLGIAMAPSVMGRMLVVVGMLTGVMSAGLMFVAAGASAGWLIGATADAARHAIARHAHAKAKAK